MTQFTKDQIEYLEKKIAFLDITNPEDGFSVKGDVFGSVLGSVWGSVEGNVWGDVLGSVGKAGETT